MSIAGETIDYGPCAFMDAFDPSAVFSSIDQQGRYAFGNQPRIALWNLTRLAECLLALLSDNEDAAIEIAKAELETFATAFDAALMKGMLAKLGIAGEIDDGELIGEFLRLLAQSHADYTLAFRRLCDAADGKPDALRDLIVDLTAFDTWVAKWRQRRETRPLDVAAMRKINPAFIPRNHRIEAVIQAAERDDFAPFEELVTVLANPYDHQPRFAAYAEPPKDDERVTQTFCGT
jgi:uncharacterized protein YdiU (UPF0061 family)